jgi:hypothetical protein
MHKGGLSGAVSIPLLWGELAAFASVGGHPPAPASPREGGMRKGEKLNLCCRRQLRFPEGVTGGGNASPFMG